MSCDEILNLERSTGIPLEGKNVSHQRYRTAGKLSRKHCKSGLAEHSNFSLVPKEMLKGGTNLLPSSFNPDFEDYHSRPHICSHSARKGTSFCHRTKQGHLSSFLLNHGQGRWGDKYLVVTDSFGIWEMLVSLPHVIETSPANLSCTAHQSSPYSSIFHLSYWNCPTVQEGIPDQLARQRKKDHNVVTEESRNATSQILMPKPLLCFNK